LVFGLLFVSRWGRRALSIIFGAMLALLGVCGLLTGKLRQQYDAAPPLQGPAAIVGSICLVGVGLLLVYLALRQRSVDAKKNAEPGAAPKGGPATPLGNSGVSKGPPSVS